MDQVQSHPAFQTKWPSHPIPLNSCSKQSISSKQPQLYHGPSPITSSIILIGVTAPLLQATISISNLSIHFQPYHSLTFKKSQMLFTQYVQMPFPTNGHLCRPIPSNPPQQLFQTIQLYHEPSPITCSLILIGVTAPLLQAHFSRHPSQGRLAHSSRWPNP